MPLSQPPLSMTKVAFGAQSLDDMRGWFADGGRRGHDPADAPGITRLTTRYLPKRHAEMIGGSVYWILKHQLVARSEITGFAEAEGGRCAILISTRLVEVHPRARRAARQVWRHGIVFKIAPALMGAAGEILPGDMAHELAKLGLL